MVVKRRLGVLLAGTVVGASFLATAPAFADDAQLQQQINAMQQQLQAMQDQLAQTKKQASAAQQQASAAQQQATVTQQNLQNIPPNLYNADLPIPTKGPPAWFDSVHISMAGSFIAMEGAWRQHNESSSGASDPPFSTIPLQNSANFYENEFRASAQQSRIALKITGDIDPAQHLKGYYESDFLGAGVTANSRESNSYNLRIRQAYFEYDNDYWGFHLAPGQQWSLLTQNRVGMLPGTENVPLTIDAQYVAGFNWSRQPEIKFIKDWGKVVWFGVSVASSATAFASNGNGVAGAPGFTPNTGLTVPPGVIVNGTNNCNAGGLLDSVTNCSNQIAPDIIEKLAVDPGWGHYEVLGLQRWFSDATMAVSAAGVPLTGAQWSQQNTFGWGVGGSALMPVWPKFVDLQGSILYGQGIGRYGSSQLADVTVGPNGNLQPLTELQFMVGAVAHPWAGNDFYVYYGQEQAQAKPWTSGTTQGGYGNGAFPESCGFDSSAAAASSTNSGGFNGDSTLCTANVQRVREITVGFWQDFYKGDLGRLRYGLEYEYVSLDLFSGSTITSATANPTPNTGLHPNNNIVFFSLRYYPFN
jgi:Tfp pilus assembly protein PilN